MKTVFWTLFWGVVATIAGAIGMAYLGIYNIGADEPHSAPVAWFLGTVVEGSVEHRAGRLEAPDLTDTARIREGAEHYAEMCAECHLAPGIADSEMRQGLYPQPPKLADKAPESPERAFWIVKHGIKMSGMPAWGKTHSNDKIWAIVAFLEALPGLSTEEYRHLSGQGAEGPEHAHHEASAGLHGHAPDSHGH